MLLFPDLLVFYASSPLDTGVFSYVINSNFGFLGLILLAGGSPAASHFSLLRQRKSNQKKGDPTVCVPSLRYGQPAVLGPAGVSCKLALLRQARSLIRLALRSSAHTEGLWGRNRNRVRGIFDFLTACLRSRLPPPPRPGWACDAPKKRDQGRALFEPQASLRGPPLFWRSAGCPKRSEGTQTAGRLFFGLLFFWRSKRKVTSRRATPGQLAPAAQKNPRTTTTVEAEK